jgi:hypothetical protein
MITEKVAALAEAQIAATVATLQRQQETSQRQQETSHREESISRLCEAGSSQQAKVIEVARSEGQKPECTSSEA